jgi:hypothetical protein
MFEDDMYKYLVWQAQLHKRLMQREFTNSGWKVVYISIAVECEGLVDHEM